MVKKLFFYLIPLSLIWSAQAYAFRLSFDHDDVIEKMDKKHNISNEWEIPGLTLVHSKGFFNWDKHHQFEWPDIRNGRPISILDVILKNYHVRLHKSVHLTKRPRLHRNPTPSPVPEPATVILLGIGLVGLVSNAKKRILS